MKCISFFADIEKVQLPFVAITEGKFKGLVFLLDSGSNNNIMFEYVYRKLKEEMPLLGAVSDLVGLEGKVHQTKVARARISFADAECETDFLISGNNGTALGLSEQLGFQMHGILGTNFMRVHNVVIDFARQRVCCLTDEEAGKEAA